MTIAAGSSTRADLDSATNDDSNARQDIPATDSASRPAAEFDTSAPPQAGTDTSAAEVDGSDVGGSGSETLWHGRFEGSTAGTLRALNDSLPFDRRMFREDIQGSRAHAMMLAAVGLLSDSERDAVLAALDRVESELAAELSEGRFRPQPGDEDIHTVVERRVSEITPAGAKLHTGRSRNDQVAADLRLWVKNALGEVAELVLALQRTLLKQAENANDARMPGYTHMQQAQPVTLAHHLLAHGWALSRDVDRLLEARRRADVSPLGAGALAGSSLPLEPHLTAAELGFSAVFDNSIDAVADRDFAADALYALAVLGLHLSRIGEEIVLWATAEFGFIELDDRYATGSSMMPQKKNPDVAELARAKAGRLIGHLTGLLATLKGLPLAYAKDMQEDKEPLFDAVDTAMLTLHALDGMIATARFGIDRMSAAAMSPYAAATDLAEWLVLEGMPFRQAHAVVGDLVRRSLTAEADAAPLYRGMSQTGGSHSQDERAHDSVDVPAEATNAADESEGAAPEKRAPAADESEWETPEAAAADASAGASSALAKLVAADPRLGPQAAALLQPGASADRRVTHGAAGPSALVAQLQRFKARLAADRARLQCDKPQVEHD